MTAPRDAQKLNPEPIVAPIEYLGMTVLLNEADQVNRAYFEHCARHKFHLQSCKACHLLRYPPAPACPWCSGAESEWIPVDAKGTVYSYYEVVHPIQPGFKPYLPYLVLLVELDTQRARPTEHESIRMLGNLVTGDGRLAPPELVAQVGIGTRVRMTFTDIAPAFAIPQWMIDDSGAQRAPWRYPG